MLNRLFLVCGMWAQQMSVYVYVHAAAMRRCYKYNVLDKLTFMSNVSYEFSLISVNISAVIHWQELDKKKEEHLFLFPFVPSN